MSFSYSISGVADFDQQWNVLPEHGKNFCVPTSWVNWMQYFAVNGRLSALPFVNGAANQIPNNIAAMGDYMDTDADDGTSSSDTIDGLLDWSEDRNVPFLLWSARATDNDNIRYTGLRNLLKMGAHVVVGRGRYTLDDGEFDRVGGHAMSVVSLQRSASGTITIGVHNPWNDSNRNTQAPSHVQQEVLTEKQRNIEGDTVTVLRWGADSVNPPYLCIDGWTAILPMFAVSNVAAGALTVYSADISTGKTSERQVALPFSGEISELTLDPTAPFATVVAKGSGEVWTLGLADDDWNRVDAVTGAHRIVYAGRRQHLLVASGNSLTAYDADGKQVAGRDIGSAVEAMSYDSANDRLIVACNGKLLSLDPRALRVGASIDAPQVPGVGRLSLSVNRGDQGITVTREDSAEVAIVRWQADGRTTTRWSRIASNATRYSAHVDHRGCMFVSEGGKIVTYDRNGERRSRSVFDGLRAGPLLKVARSNDPLDRTRSQRKGWRN
jgi:hypothetical protein